MPYRVTVVMDLFKGPHEQALSHKALQHMLDCLYRIDCDWLAAHPETPGIYDSGIVEKAPGKMVSVVQRQMSMRQLEVEQPDIRQTRMHYQEEPLGQEDWKDIPTCLQDGIADCEDLACWRAAELTVRHGIQARPFFSYKVRPNGSYLYHIKVKYPDGTEEDPSRKLGMGRHLF